ncbi:restriction endonuclease PLD domain-containing protein [uncultured Psychrobacillus sp.]|mgnify:CR=1 FL=1|uniref:restriction endonuclease PLD domain-containing protein n=1 Tax=uncultured Psychrobacillus sp. TaxID=1551585 RepID=UPI0026244842|nr:restriction endonuclease PLD domain-containing protein [uncultured Psychrobacillus sp.]
MPIVYLYSRRENEVQRQAGLNWGFSNGNVCTADAYIALNKDFFRQNPNFFPPRSNTITVLWDDGISMTCLLEGSQLVDGYEYPKQLSTYNDKSALGIYLRTRLRVSNNHFVSRNDLRNYGREDIDINYDERNNIYLFDFSV